ncbi:MAG: hypothetical protein KAI83_12555 [Thiomargarita sp.]|nr:hypothetical protein [Thiomargarita sp.]
MFHKIEDAAYLVSCGLKPKLNPHNNIRYRECIDAYQTDDEYREMVKQIVTGFGLRVLDVSKLGIVMAVVEKQSPFRPILADHINTRFAEVEQRLMFGATILTIAAICFPNESSFDYDRARYVTVKDVRQRLIQLAESFNDKRDEQEVVPGLTDAWEVINEKAPIARHPSSGRHKAGSLFWVVEQTFKYLAEQKFISLKADEEDGTYRTHSKFRIYVREFSAMRAFEVIREALVKTEETINYE